MSSGRVLGMDQTNDGQKKHQKHLGILALVCGIFSIVLIWFPLTNIIAIVCAVLAVLFGYIGKKHGDRYGLYGFILGIITIILLIVLLSIATFYVYVTGFVGGAG